MSPSSVGSAARYWRDWMAWRLRWGRRATPVVSSCRRCSPPWISRPRWAWALSASVSAAGPRATTSIWLLNVLATCLLPRSEARPLRPRRALHRRARHRAVGAEHAAVARQWLERRAATLADMRKPARVGRHLFDRSVPAVGTGQRRRGLHRDGDFVTGLCLSNHGRLISIVRY